MGPQVVDGYVATEHHVAEEPVAWVGLDLLVDPNDVLDLLVIRRDAAAHRP